MTTSLSPAFDVSNGRLLLQELPQRIAFHDIQVGDVILHEFAEKLYPKRIWVARVEHQSPETLEWFASERYESTLLPGGWTRPKRQWTDGLIRAAAQWHDVEELGHTIWRLS